MQMYLNSNSSESGKISLEGGLGLLSTPWQSLSSDSLDLQMVFLHLGPTSSHVPIYLGRSPPTTTTTIQGLPWWLRIYPQGKTLGFSPRLERSPAEGNGYTLQ